MPDVTVRVPVRDVIARPVYSCEFFSIANVFKLQGPESVSSRSGGMASFCVLQVIPANLNLDHFPTPRTCTRDEPGPVTGTVRETAALRAYAALLCQWHSSV